jgi:L-alanine-DL-glutamate epimerase-like enolase superfamily enzyme
MKLELRRVRHAAPGARDARRSWAARESLLVGISEAGGALGVGEASPLPGYSPDELARVEAALSGLRPAEVARALDHASVRGALLALAELVPSHLPSARFALETAGLDLLGKRRAQSAPELLGAEGARQRQLAALLGPASASSLVSDAEQALRAGFQQLKLKLGEPGRLEPELTATARLREQLGPRVGLRLDANGALGEEELARAWRVLEPLDIELFEEPGQLPASLGGAVPLALDESLQGLSPPAAVALCAARGARCLVLKPTALGGLSHCLSLAELAAQAGKSVVVSHSFDGPFAWRAAAALALALPASLAHGLAPHPALAAWQMAPLPVQGGWLSGWQEPGLGNPAEHGFA